MMALVELRQLKILIVRGFLGNSRDGSASRTRPLTLSIFYMETIHNRINDSFGIVPAFALQEGKLGPRCFAIYAALCIYANKSRRAWPSQQTLAELLSVDVKTIRRAINELEQLGYLIVERPKRQGRGQFNRYYLVDKRGTVDTPLDPKGGQKGTKPPLKRGTVGTYEQNHKTKEKGNNFFHEGEDMGFSPRACG